VFCAAQTADLLMSGRLLLGLLFSSLDASIVSTSLVAISSDLSNFVDAPWVVLSYLLAYLGMSPLHQQRKKTQLT
jgi:MFS family permease